MSTKFGWWFGFISEGSKKIVGVAGGMSRGAWEVIGIWGFGVLVRDLF